MPYALALGVSGSIMVRASTDLYNTVEEVERLIATVTEIARAFI